MDKSLLKNSWVLAGLLLVINIVLGLIILAVVNFFKIGSSGISSISGIIGAMFVGQIYTATFREIMPTKLRFSVTTIYILAQIAIGSAYALISGVQNLPLFLGILIGLSLFYSLFVYLMLGVGGKSQLNAFERKESAKKK